MNQSKIIAAKACERELNRILESMVQELKQAESRAIPHLIDQRASVAFDYFHLRMRKLASWLVTSRENTNFTYEITLNNAKQIASAVSLVTGVPVATNLHYVDELLGDSQLAEHIARLASGVENADPNPFYGRRIGWYCFARALKPSLIVETGVDKGMGSAVLCSALLQNRAEGFSGHYIGTDINPAAGLYLSGPYKDTGEIVYGDSLASLKKLPGPIDLFINDSDHSGEYEAEEYKAIETKLRSRSVILGDNSHCTDKLLDFAVATNRQFFFINEAPDNHWYPGAGIGVAY